MANAAGRLRSNETQCGNGDLQNHAFGVDGSVTGKHGFTILGDLATVICSYDQTAGYTSNSLASYFHDFGWRQRLYDNVQNWLLISSNGQGVKSSAVQSLGGNYGEATPSDLSFEVTAAAATAGPAGTKPDHDTQKGALRGPTQEDSEPTCAADKDPRLVTYTNTLSALSAAELVRRIALHREVPAELQFPNATWRDIQVLIGYTTYECFTIAETGLHKAWSCCVFCVMHQIQPHCLLALIESHIYYTPYSAMFTLYFVRFPITRVLWVNSDDPVRSGAEPAVPRSSVGRHDC